MATEETIADVTALCLKHFNDCLVVESLMADEWAENRLADFNIWIFSVGATACGRASLDSRLASSPGTREIIVELLHLLDKLICQCKSLVDDTEALESASMPNDDEDLSEVDQSREQDIPRSFSPWSDGSETHGEQINPGTIVPDNPLVMRMKHIETILDQLARLSVAIRRSGNHSRLQKTDQGLNPDEHLMFRDNLIKELLRGTGHITDLTEVQKRLIDANIWRRNRIIYTQTHAGYFGMDLDRPNSRHTISQSTSAGSSEELTQGKSKIESKPYTHSEVGTTTTATAIDSLPVLDIIRVRAPGATATMSSSTVVNPNYPRPPRIEDGTKLFRCPYCCQVLPIDLAEDSKWKEHLAGDIVPYTCILPNCATPDVLFPTKDAWRRHIFEEHYNYEYWTCVICRNGLELPDKETFMAHTNSQHTGSVNQDHIPILVGLSQRSFPAGIRCCLFCGWPQAEGAVVDKDDLIEHIAQEIYAFSLRSLPSPDGPNGIEDEAVNRSKEASEEATGRLRQSQYPGNPSSVNTFEGPPKMFFILGPGHNGYFLRVNSYAPRSSSPVTPSKSNHARVLDHTVGRHRKKKRERILQAEKRPMREQRRKTKDLVSQAEKDRMGEQRRERDKLMSSNAWKFWEDKPALPSEISRERGTHRRMSH